MEGQHHALALAFDTDSVEFARGVEIGRLWEQLKTDDDISQNIMAENAEMALRLAEATGREIISEEIDHDRLVVTFSSP
jgi:hypothetical protein